MKKTTKKKKVSKKIDPEVAEKIQIIALVMLDLLMLKLKLCMFPKVQEQINELVKALDEVTKTLLA